jgi:hypothetical protein
MFGSKALSPRMFGNKAGINTSSFGSKKLGRKTSNTINKINDYLIPGLTAGSAFAPELAPMFGTVGVVAKAAGGIAKHYRDY